MDGWITVWVTAPALPDDANPDWFEALDRLEGDSMRAGAASTDDEGRGSATLRVRAAADADAVAVVRGWLSDTLGEPVAREADVRTTPNADDDDDFDDFDDFDEAGIGERSLQWRRRPLEWSEFSPGEDEDLLRVHYVQAGTAHGPGAAIAEVVVSEVRTTVSVSLFERVLAGTYPDGTGAAEALAAVRGCLQVRLHRRLGQRRVIDGTTGRPARRLDADDLDDRDVLAAAGRRGCPVWEP